MTPIYLDFAAASPTSKKVMLAMQPFFSGNFYNPSALYSGAREAKQALEEARSLTAQTIGARPSEVIFTAGGTESANLAISGVMQHYPDAELIISAVEHDAVRIPASKYQLSVCPVDQKGVVDLAKLEKLITDSTVLVSIMYANNEVGTVQPIKLVAEMIAQKRLSRRKAGVKLPLLFHADACQAPNYLDVNVARLGVDLMTLNGGKIYGPKQSGILYHRAGVELAPQILGGGQELGLRSGTENIAFAVGFSVALNEAARKRHESAKSVRILTDKFAKDLESRFGARLNGHAKKRLPNNVHVTFKGKDNERILFSLDEQNVWAAAGSACSASSQDASHVLMAMGVSEQDSRGSVRFSIGHGTTQSDLEKTLEALEAALKA